jgi:hypothetical protein
MALAGIALCPSEMSWGCGDTSRCQSTCVGQYQPGTSCTLHVSDGNTITRQCTAATGAQTLYECPNVPSFGCSRTSDCQSTCVGQITNLATCTYHRADGTAIVNNCALLGTQTF